MKHFTILLGFIFFVGAAYCIPTSIIENIHTDQFGYRCVAQKIAVISSAQTGYYGSAYTPGAAANQYEIRKWDTDEPIFIGTLTAWNGGATQAQSGDKVWWLDFSSVIVSGSYYVYDAFTGKASNRFEISDQVYKPILKQAIKAFYYQRCGVSKLSTFAGTGYADGACHLGSLQDNDCRLYNNNNVATSKNLSGGWHDAGDYNKYVNFTYETLIELMLAYEENPTIWTDNIGIPESGNGVPDILDEIKVELDWLLKMQQGDGSVLSVVGVKNFASASPPSADAAQRYYGPATTEAGYTFAAVCAFAAKHFTAIGNTTYGATLQTAAINAYNWSVANPTINFYNSGLVAAGEQEDGYNSYETDTCRKLAANIFLFAATGNTTYKTYVENKYQLPHLVRWGYIYPFEPVIQDVLMYYSSLPSITASVKTNIQNAYKNSMLYNSENLPAFTSNTDAYRAFLPDRNYVDGHTRNKAHMALLFYNTKYYNLDNANNSNYQNATSGYLHYIHGVNPTGFAFLSNMSSFGAEKSVPEFYNGWFADGSALWDRVGTSTYGPPPGYVIPGTNPNYNRDNCCNSTCGSTAANNMCNTALITPPLGQPIQKAFKDFNPNWPQNSWSVTEAAIYYQAAYIKLLSKFIDNSTCGVALPIKRFVFIAALKNNLVSTNWKMNNEDDVKEYVVEKSIDGLRFNYLGKINCTKNISYTLIDSNVLANLNYYRLKIISTNGKIEYSEIVLVEKKKESSLFIYPNPTREFVQVRYFENNKTSNAKIVIKDNTGNIVLQQNIIIKKGQNNFSILVNKLANSIYFISLEKEHTKAETLVFSKIN